MIPGSLEKRLALIPHPLRCLVSVGGQEALLETSCFLLFALFFGGRDGAESLVYARQVLRCSATP